MPRRDASGRQRRQDALQRDGDGELRLVLRGDHLKHVPVPDPDDAPLPASPASDAPEAPEARGDVPAATERVMLEPDALEAANRARIEALHRLRTTAPVDSRDAFVGGLWVLLVIVPVGVAGSVFLRLRIVWAAGLAALVLVAVLILVVSELERRDRKLLREIEKGIVPPPPRPEFHWRSVTPAAVVRRLRADLDAINVDDTALEDELEPLYRHGNEMENGWSGGWR